MYVYMKCVLTNDFMRSASSDLVHHWVRLGGRDKLAQNFAFLLISSSLVCHLQSLINIPQ